MILDFWIVRTSPPKPDELFVGKGWVGSELGGVVPVFVGLLDPAVAIR